MDTINALNIVTGNLSNKIIHNLKIKIIHLENMLHDVERQYELFVHEDFIPIHPQSNIGCCVCGQTQHFIISSTIGMYKVCVACHERWIFKGASLYDSQLNQWGKFH